MLVELRKVLNIPDRKQEKLHHFLELIVLEVVIMVLDVIDRQLLGQLQLIKHNVCVIGFVDQAGLPVLPLAKDVSPLSHQLNPLNTLQQLLVPIHTRQLLLAHLYHFEQPVY